MKVAIVSADTMIYRKQKDDTCSPIVRRVLDQVSFKTELVQPVPNDREVIRKILAKIADAQMADLILTIGGIGCREEDCVPEATKAVVDKEIPGIGESMRLFMTRTRKRAMLTRGTAGIRGKSPTVISSLFRMKCSDARCSFFAIPISFGKIYSTSGYTSASFRISLLK